MTISVLTLFPEAFTVFERSIIKRAQVKNLAKINILNLRDWSNDAYGSVDDRPYGGGAGMILRVDIIHKAVEDIIKKFHDSRSGVKIIVTDAGGEIYTQKNAQRFSSFEDMIIICGHYEGIDHRVHEYMADEIVSIGEYVLSGGEIPAMVVVDSVIRLIPGVLGNSESLSEESHNTKKNEYPQYTRPEEYNNWKVPQILLSGDHKKISDWRKSKQE